MRRRPIRVTSNGTILTLTKGGLVIEPTEITTNSPATFALPDGSRYPTFIPREDASSRGETKQKPDT